MKKFYVFLSAACFAASAFAVDKEMAVAPVSISQDFTRSMKAAPFSTAVKTVKAEYLENALAKTRADETPELEYTYYRPAPEFMCIGFTPSGYSLNGNFGFGSSYGNVVFNGFCVGQKSLEWNYSDINAFTEDGEWIVSVSDKQDLTFKNGVGGFMVPELSTVYNSGSKDEFSMDFLDEYITGGGPELMFGPDPDGGYVGATFYQNFLMPNPEGYAGDLNITYAYAPGIKNFSDKGVYSSWEKKLATALNGEVSDIVYENLTLIQPKPASTYIMTKAWLWCGLEASAATQLISYIYPIEEDGSISESPIALGYAAIPEGQSEMIVFEYNPLDEEGDEIEGDIYIDTAVAITVEGFNGNEAIDIFYPLTGYYPINYNALDTFGSALIKPASSRIKFSLKVDGNQDSKLVYDNGLYYFDQTVDAKGNIVNPDIVTLMSYCQLFVDAIYPYIHTVGGEESVKIPEAGGSIDVDIEALFYNINGLIADGVYEVNAPEWLTVSFGDSDKQTGVTKMTLAAEPSEAGRTGYVTIEGWGAKLNLEVIQGEGAAVNVVVADRNALYFDLQGRRVANPEKGIFIKKTGNKAEKVIL